MAEIKNEELYRLREGLAALKNVSGKLDFLYAIVRNKRIVEDEIKTIEEMFAPDEKYKEFMTKQRELVLKYCKRDENGQPVTQQINGGLMRYAFEPENMEKYNAEVEKLAEEYQDAIKGAEEKEQKRVEMMQQTVRINLWKIDKEALPDGLTAGNLEAIWPIIKYSK